MKKIFNIPEMFKLQPEIVAEKLRKKNFDFNVEKFIALTKKRTDLTAEIQSINEFVNNAAKTDLSKKTPDEKKAIFADVKTKKETLKKLKVDLENAQTEFENFFCEIPNIPNDDVADGQDENDNVLIKTVGNPTIFNFDVKDHVEIGLRNKNIDHEAGVELAGRRFVVMRDYIAALHRALIQFMLETHKEDGYIEHYLPYMVNDQALYGTGQLPKFQEDLFQIANREGCYLIPTAEVPLTNLYAGKILDKKELPINMVAHTPCFRAEAGSYGKDIVGLIRQHQFEKVEIVKITDQETSYQELENLLEQSEKILKALALPYRVVSLCGGDLGFSAAKTYDIEVWIPSQGKYREIASISNCEDFQARRMAAKYKDGNVKKYVHTLNGSALAVGRCMLAIVENYQQEDGSVKIPDALKKYWKNGQDVILKKC